MLVSILIPTKNSGPSLSLTLQSLQNQNYKNIEIIVSDSRSTDCTQNIVRDFGYELSICDGKVLAARIDGIQKAAGDIVILLDSDQQMLSDTISRVVDKMYQGYDMIVLEEIPSEMNGIMAKMWQREREIATRDIEMKVEPMDGAILPRAFRSKLIKEAVTKIPTQITPWVSHPDHQIIYYECSKISRRTGYMNRALYYFERTNPLDLIRTYFSHGRDAKRLVRYERYRDLISSKFMKKTSGYLTSGLLISSNLLILLKSVSFVMGYVLSK